MKRGSHGYMTPHATCSAHATPDETTKAYLAPTGGQAYFDNQEWAMP